MSSKVRVKLESENVLGKRLLEPDPTERAENGDVTPGPPPENESLKDRDMYEEGLKVHTPSCRKGLKLKARYARIRAAVVDAYEQYKNKIEKKPFYTLSPVLVRGDVLVNDAESAFFMPECKDIYKAEHQLTDGNLHITAVSPHNQRGGLIQAIASAVNNTWMEPTVQLARGPRVNVSSAWKYPGGVMAPSAFIVPDFSVRHYVGVFDVRVGEISPRQIREELECYVGEEAERMQYAVVVQLFSDGSAAAVQWERDHDQAGSFSVKAALDFGIAPISEPAKIMYHTSTGNASRLRAVPMYAWVRHAVVYNDDAETALNTRPEAEPRPISRQYPTNDCWYQHTGAAGRPVLHFTKSLFAGPGHEGDYGLDLGESYLMAFDGCNLHLHGVGDPALEGRTVAEMLQIRQEQYAAAPPVIERQIPFEYRKDPRFIEAVKAFEAIPWRF